MKEFRVYFLSLKMKNKDLWINVNLMEISHETFKCKIIKKFHQKNKIKLVF